MKDYSKKYREENREDLQRKRDDIKEFRAERQRNYYKALSPERKKEILERNKKKKKKNYYEKLTPEKKEENKNKAKEKARSKRRKYLEENPHLIMCIDCQNEHPEGDRRYLPKRCEGCKKESIRTNRKNNKRSRQERHLEYRQTSFGAVKVLMGSVRQRSKKKNRVLELDEEWITERLIKNKGRCEQTGYPFNYTYKTKYSRPYAPSIHRIDPNKGYTKDNSVIVCWAWNRIVGDSRDGIAQTLIDSYIEKKKADANKAKVKAESRQAKLWARMENAS